MSRRVKVFRIIFINLFVTIVLLLLIEGFASTLFVAHNIISNQPIAERRHTRYDEELGWINIPNLHIPDMYGPGIYLRTNSRAFRNDTEFSTNIPPDKVRIVCSGDSFTLGFGVNNDHTWCQLLVSRNNRLQTVNMGQGGYGVDQAYLWYMRDGIQLDHNIHIFAFITDDFIRMQSDTFMGYGKPFLELHGSDLVIANSPVSKRAYYVPWLTDGLRAVATLDSVKLLRRLLVIDNGSLSLSSAGYQPDKHTQAVVSRIFSNLQHVANKNQRLLVLVYLPTEGDYVGRSLTDQWRKFVYTESVKHDMIFIDLIDDFRRLPPQTLREMFDAHYTKAGNRLVAELIYTKMRAIPAIDDTLRP